ncbi:hypothetical protein BD289DRAFT_483651 [Coniella lustricola]|uniref:CBM1 domain-containing protein n=1 Tax=Coniella lustricola TaxID=2025994 RepID=A0A2T3A4P7_9PEZI|nr:hypothetical protein BD289DRAFT_483651 [Coniella lustricola]
MNLTKLMVVAILSGSAVTQTFPVYGQCGGDGFTSAGSCASGSYCQSENAFYYQCVPGTATGSTSAATQPASTSAKTTTTPATTTHTSSSSTSSKVTTAISTATAASSTSTRYLFVFGDSYSTTEFYIQGGYPSASDPIGLPTLPGDTTSGGLNWVGLVTSQLNTSLVLTYDWAYYGADTSNAIIATGVTTDFIAQVGEFEEYLVPAPSEAPWTASNSQVAVWMGINDVGECFWESEVYATCPIDEVMETYFGLLEDLYNDGVRDFLLLMVPPFYKAPIFADYTTAELQSLIDDIQSYNEALETNLATFKSSYSGVTGSVFNTSASFWTVIDNPTAYGATDATCQNTDGTTCVWYDDYHPGQAIQKLVAEALANGYVI